MSASLPLLDQSLLPLHGISHVRNRGLTLSGAVQHRGCPLADAGWEAEFSLSAASCSTVESGSSRGRSRCTKRCHRVVGACPFSMVALPRSARSRSSFGLSDWPAASSPSRASLWIAAGVELVEVSMLLGHSELRVTADLNSHLGEQTASTAARHMEAVLAASRF